MKLHNRFFNKCLVCIALSFLMVVLINAETKAQSLEFSRVLMVTASDTVPVGKVWKVVSLISNETSVVNGNTRIRIDGTNHTIADCDPNGRCFDFIKMPIWFPEGVALEPSSGVDGISVVEFSIVP